LRNSTGPEGSIQLGMLGESRAERTSNFLVGEEERGGDGNGGEKSPFRIKRGR